MAISKVVEPHEVVKANNELFRCKYKIKDVVAGRIFMAFASLVNHNDVKENQSFVEYRINANSILPDTCMGGNNYKQLQEAANSLLDQKIELRISKNEYYFYTLFSKIGYNNGVIVGEFHKDLMPFFMIAKEKFTKMQLHEYMRLPSIYSQYIFSFLKSWYDKKYIIVKIHDLYEMLDAPKSCRNDFYNFKVRILDKACKDINEKTSMSYKWEPIKTGRSVTEIKFTFLKLAKNKDDSEEILELGDNSHNNDAIILFNEFLSRFVDGKLNHLKAGIKWYALNNDSKAPLPQDVPDNNELGIIDFLDRWNASHTVTASQEPL